MSACTALPRRPADILSNRHPRRVQRVVRHINPRGCGEPWELLVVFTALSVVVVFVAPLGRCPGLVPWSKPALFDYNSITRTVTPRFDWKLRQELQRDPVGDGERVRDVFDVEVGVKDV